MPDAKSQAIAEGEHCGWRAGLQDDDIMIWCKFAATEFSVFFAVGRDVVAD